MDATVGHSLSPNETGDSGALRPFMVFALEDSGARESVDLVATQLSHSLRRHRVLICRLARKATGTLSLTAISRVA